ncbi:MAG: hypothetical protein JO202_09955 [Ktedonobacteraceae bacterium]|nr:hypothetical protein [Ktedonobacteraceae bacterium]
MKSSKVDSCIESSSFILHTPNLDEAAKQQLGKGENVLYAIDIDGTIARPEAVLIAFHNQEFALGLTSEELRCTYSHFLQLPQVAELRREALQDSRQRARTTPETVLAYDEVEHAAATLNLLAKQGEIMYYTVRPACVQDVTYTWLQKKHFPHPHNIILCHSVLNKLVQLFVHERETHHRIVLIDDRYQQMIEDFARLAHGEFSHISDWQEVVHFAQQRVLLVAFGATCMSADTTGLQVVPMQSWKHIAAVHQLSFIV